MDTTTPPTPMDAPSSPESRPMDGSQHKRLWRTFLLNISLVLLIFTFGAFVGMLMSHEKLIQAEMLSRARAHFKDIVLTRRWNASFGGVYVEKKPGVVSNTYLKNPDITATSGVVYTLKNPALMTREISELAQTDGDYRFHITSLNLKNPHNAPDPWEREALLSFNRGVTETSGILSSESGSQFRYMAPLLVEEKCLECHRDQGYKLGDVRGGISVTFDISHIQKSLEHSRILLIMLAILFLVLLLGVIYFFVSQLSRQLTSALKQLREMATTDALTGLFNRRTFFDRLADEVSRHKRHRRDLACIFIDMDHFKKINDQYGHFMGDEALRSVGRILRQRCRNEDLCARYGGEELVVLLPETSLEGARLVAEDLRQTIEETPIPLASGEAMHLTASFGVACIPGHSMEWSDAANALLLQADLAVFQAKAQGRNQVVLAEEEQEPTSTPAES